MSSINITASNISQYFTVSNSTYYFVGNGSTFTSNNNGINNSTAKTTLTAKYNFPKVTFNYSYSSEARYDKLTITVGSTTVADALSGVGNSSWTGAVRKGTIITFQYIKDSSNHGNNDKCTFSNIMVEEPGGNKNIYIGIDNKARHVKKLYIGINGIARKIKKGYIGVNGKARLFYSAGSNIGQMVDLGYTSNGRWYMGSASFNGYACFIGGVYGENYDKTATNYLEVFNNSLTQSFPTTIFISTYQINSAVLKSSQLMIPCTKDSFNTSWTNTRINSSEKMNDGVNSASNLSNYVVSCNDQDIYFIDSSLTVTAKNNFFGSNNYGGNGKSVGANNNYVIFTGGRWGSGSWDKKDYTYAIDSSMTEHSVSSAGIAADDIATVTLNNNIIFAGGDNHMPNLSYAPTKTVSCFNSSLTHTYLDDLVNTTSKDDYTYTKTGTVCGDFAIFGTNYLNLYDSSLTQTVNTSLKYPHNEGSLASTENYAIYKGNYKYSAGYADALNIY